MLQDIIIFISIYAKMWIWKKINKKNRRNKRKFECASFILKNRNRAHQNSMNTRWRLSTFLPSVLSFQYKTQKWFINCYRRHGCSWRLQNERKQEKKNLEAHEQFGSSYAALYNNMAFFVFNRNKMEKCACVCERDRDGEIERESSKRIAE